MSAIRRLLFTLILLGCTSAAGQTLCLNGASTTYGMHGDTWGYHYAEIVRQWLSPLGYEVKVFAIPGIRWAHWRPEAGDYFGTIYGEIQPEDFIGPPNALGTPTWVNFQLLHPFTYYTNWSECDLVWMLGGQNSASLGFPFVPVQPVHPDDWIDDLATVAEAIASASPGPVLIAMDYRTPILPQYPDLALVDFVMQAYELYWLDYTESPPPGILRGPNIFRSIDVDVHFNATGDFRHPNYLGHLHIAGEFMEALAPIAMANGWPWFDE